jgi:hypothetical protein
LAPGKNIKPLVVAMLMILLVMVLSLASGFMVFGMLIINYCEPLPDRPPSVFKAAQRKWLQVMTCP